MIEGWNIKYTLVFVATTPFAVNSHLRSQILALARLYQVVLCVNTLAYSLDEDIIKAVRVHHIDIARRLAPFRDLGALIQMFLIFKKIRPTVVHSITPKAGLLGMLAARISGVPLRFHTFTGQIWANKVGIRRRFLKALDRLIVCCASQVLADSVSQCIFLEQEGVARLGGVRVLGKGSIAGVNLSRFRPNAFQRRRIRDELRVASDTPIFLFVGRIVRDKGVFDMVEAMVYLNGQYPSWELWVVGPDEDGLQDKLQSEGNQRGARIRWFGSSHSPEHFMAVADVLILPSYREGFGSVIIEAAACATPCIAYEVVGVVDAIIDKYTGLFTKITGVDGLIDAMRRLGECPDEVLRLGDAARTRVVHEFSSEVVTNLWLKFYADALDL